MKNIVKKVICSATAVVMVASASVICVSASNGINWNVYRPANTPNGAGITTYYGYVTDLREGVDDAIDFTCGYYKGGSKDTYVKCCIQTSLRKRVGDYVMLDRFGDFGSCSFKNEWYYNTNHNRCKISVSLQDYTGTNGVDIRGNAK